MPTSATPAYTPLHLAANQSKLVKSGPGVLHGVTVNSKGAGANTLTIYDGLTAAGTVLGVLDTTAGVGQVPYDVAFGVGLYVTLGTGTAADLTIEYL